MNFLRNREDDDGYIGEGKQPLSPFKSGSRVREGAFSGVEGAFLHCDGEQRAMVLLDLMQRVVRSAVPLEALTQA